jgi:DNA polymerase-1
VAATLPEPGDPGVLWVIDLSGLVHRFWHTVGPWAARSVADRLRRFVVERQPTRVAIAEDLPFPTFRHDLMAEWGLGGYKSTRADRPPNERGQIAEQMRLAREYAEDECGFVSFAHQGFEADDVIATLVDRADTARLRSVVLAADKDMAQLVDDDRVLIWNGKPDGRGSAVTGPEEVHEKFGVWPWQFVDYLAMVGDKSDAIPGIKNIGVEAAQRVLAEFFTLDAAFAEAAKGREVHPFWARPYHGRVWSALASARAREAADHARLLVRLRKDVPLPEHAIEATKL